MDSKSPDVQLIEQVIYQNRLAQKEFFEKFSPKMLGTCRQYIRDLHDAEDVMLHAFMKVFQNIGQFKNEGSLEGWIRRIMVYECIDFLRVKKNNFNHQDIEDVTISENESVYEMEDFSVDDIQNMIDNLPDGYKMVFNLYAIEGYKHQEIAEMLQISEGTSKSQLSNARKLLQQQIVELKKKRNGTK